MVVGGGGCSSCSGRGSGSGNHGDNQKTKQSLLIIILAIGQDWNKKGMIMFFMCSLDPIPERIVVKNLAQICNEFKSLRLGALIDFNVFDELST